ncbi:MAG: hypothetical protein U0T81_05765 [Saprospiraceae bacterium]
MTFASDPPFMIITTILLDTAASLSYSCRDRQVGWNEQGWELDAASVPADLRLGISDQQKSPQMVFRLVPWIHRQQHFHCRLPLSQQQSCRENQVLSGQL